jgi:hypothetical protein
VGDTILSRLLRQYAPMLKRLAHGPESTTWPCPHAHQERDKRNGAMFCTDCYHWVTKESP